MKFLQLFPILLLFSTLSYGQVLDDLNNQFIKDLIWNGVDTNNDGLIQLSEALQTDTLRLVNYSGLTGVDGLEHFLNLTYLFIDMQNVGTLNVSEFKNLEELHTGMWSVENIVADGLEYLKILSTHFGVASVSLNGTENIVRLSTQDNFGIIPVFDYSKLTKIEHLFHHGLPMFKTLDLDPLVNLESLFLSYHTAGIFENITIKNGRHTDIQITRTSNVNDALRYICTDDDEIDYVKGILKDKELNTIEVNTYCSFENGGNLKYISGANHIDVNENGCDEDDPTMPYLKYEFTHLSNGESIIKSSRNGSYSFKDKPGSYTIRPIINNPDYFRITPEIQNIQITESESEAFLDFCIEKVGDKNDLSIVLHPVSRARPGFTSEYVISYKNNGNTNASGEISLKFDNDHMKFIESNIEAESLDHGEMIWRFDDLVPNVSGQVSVVFELNRPTNSEFPLIGGEQLKFDATINPDIEDISVDDNQFNLEQLVVNSYDPNDITCLEGDSLSFLKTGEYVHYMVRFENTGTAEAINIVVRDTIDTNKFDVTSLIPVDGSHNFDTKISGDGIVEFIFENINLPFTEEEKHGYVVFKLKTKESLIEGDQFENSAAIYFDYNFPIFTNEFETQVVGIALPVTLSKFDAHQDDDNININWFVQSEKNLSHYVVERRHESEETFESVGKVNATNRIEYAAIDENLTNQGVYYYRLRMIDNDGITQLSDVITVEYKAKHTSILVYPNPASDYIIVENNQAENTLIKIHNTAGQEVGNFNVNQNSRKQIDISQFNKGLHFVTFYQDFNLEVKKIFIDK